MKSKNDFDMDDRPYKIKVFQQGNRAESKVKGIQRYGQDQFDVTLMTIRHSLPEILDDTSEFLPDRIDADLVLDFLIHPDLSYDLSVLCRQLEIPVVASGKKVDVSDTHTPAVCCALARHSELGLYSRCFGAPEFDVTVKNGHVVTINVLRGAPCGATWEAARRVKGCDIDDAPVRIGLDTQFFCTADPSNWDPIWGKSPVHLAADIHRAALLVALRKADR